MPNVKIQAVGKFFDELNNDKRVSVFQGGSRSGKTYNILLWLIFTSIDEWDGYVISICRATMPSIKGSVMRDFFEILGKMGLYKDKNHNKTDNLYKLGNNVFEFISLDQPQKVRGRKRNVLFLNEANEIDWDSWIQLSMRTTGKIILDFNPSMEYHWIYDEVIPRDDSLFFKSTYQDNPFLDENTIREIERLKDIDDNYWKIYGLGEKGHLEGLVFSNWKQVDRMPNDVKKLFYGLDFGYTNDPTALIGIALSEGELWLDEMIYQTGMTNPDIARRMKDLKVDGVIYADSAEPKSIAEIRHRGMDIRGATKGKGSILQGIDVLKRYRMNVTKRSVNLIKELRNYKWDTDRDGRLINKPIDAFNHGVDATRYGCLMTLGRKREFIVR